MMLFDFEEEKVVKFIRQYKNKSVGIQLPAGLKRYCDEILEVYYREGIKPIVFDSCFGSCDLADKQACQAGCSALVHYGHSDMGLRTEIPVLYVEARVKNLDLEPLEKIIGDICGKKVAIFTTVQYIDYLSDLAAIIRRLGGIPMIGQHGWRTKYDGQILGCDLQSVRSVLNPDRLLYLGTGRFHPLGASIISNSPVICVNPHTFEVEEISGEEFLRKRMAYIMRARDARKWCVVVSTKPGQFRFALAEKIYEKLLRNERKATLLIVDKISSDSLADFDPDAAVIVACPRIPIDDWELFDFPVLTSSELSIILEEKASYELDEVKEQDFIMALK